MQLSVSFFMQLFPVLKSSVAYKVMRVKSANCKCAKLTFSVFPFLLARNKILQGMLGANLIGFQVSKY